MLKTMIVCVFALLSIGCSQKIIYRTSDISASNESALRGLSVSVSYPTDQRRQESSYKDALFNSDIDNDDDCYNAEESYRRAIPAHEIAQMLCQHLQSMHIFRSVYINKPDSADLSIKFTLNNFEGHCSINKSAQKAQAVGSALFGAIGALVSAAATSDMESEFDFKIQYSGVTIADKNGRVLLVLDSFISGRQKSVAAVTDCSTVYSLLNSELKTHNQLFIDNIVQELSAVLRTSR